MKHKHRLVLRIDSVLYEAHEDMETGLWTWDPVIGGPPLGGVFVSERLAVQFALDRVRQLGDVVACFKDLDEPEAEEPRCTEHDLTHCSKCWAEPEETNEGGY